ncbi:hypothetical protein HMPREF1545_01789 [Oscillibacter sp. KLE 1728]|nr:hypothetical protein HMPREF1546_03740 [Oscillibacter sp. KLE 1745]ERK60983.1 hypothetical protein HMPREF1545_01789 [Oscillibacter sp. KLE 1728]
MRSRSFFPSSRGGQRDFLSYFTAGGCLLSKSMEFMKNPADFPRMRTAISPVFPGVFVPGRAFASRPGMCLPLFSGFFRHGSARRGTS